MKVKMILPALTEAKSPFFRPTFFCWTDLQDVLDSGGCDHSRSRPSPRNPSHLALTCSVRDSCSPIPTNESFDLTVCAIGVYCLGALRGDPHLHGGAHAAAPG